ncbi:unnamed protein product [Adineta ricciae]|uniref:Nuclear receptor n=1 Tax=Adineta ricciae TaxID=249248 RepID=A0A814CW94_ADIRI|nr:unnamed protein product [Adineta ricciae]CAF1522935.1 unnamed protein product [Adineta ricciae]
MTTEKNLIFITSDEDLIHEISLKKSQNTHLIDLDTGKPIIPTLTKHKSKSTNSICIICGDRAIGYNYNVLSCASCKAFFHRYAHENLETMQCLKGKNQCQIDYKVNRKCFYCRLNKCLLMGMRKDLILNQKQIQEKRKDSKTIQSTQQFNEIDQFLMNINENDINEILHEDLILINNIKSSFLSIFENQYQSLPESIDFSTDAASAIISWAQFDSEIALETIRFFRQINQFENLHSDDRFILIKYHLFSIMLIRKSFNYRPTNLRNSIEINKEKERYTRMNALFNVSNDLQNQMDSFICLIIEYTEHDPILLSILLIISLFSPTLSLNLDEPLFKDSLSIYQAQNFYINILWNYLIQNQNERIVYKKFLQLITIIFRVQLISVTSRKFIRDYLISTNSVHQITELMQTILHIS